MNATDEFSTQCLEIKQAKASFNRLARMLFQIKNIWNVMFQMMILLDEQ